MRQAKKYDENGVLIEHSFLFKIKKSKLKDDDLFSERIESLYFYLFENKTDMTLQNIHLAILPDFDSIVSEFTLIKLIFS